MRVYQNKMCDLCGQRPATRHAIIVINGAQYEGEICEQCYQDSQVRASSVYQAFMGQPELECPVCHTRLSDVADGEYVGCSECYNVFRSQVLKNISEMHGTRKHIGKRLRVTKKSRKIELSDKENLKEQYHLAVDEGRADDAEELYGFIKKEENDNE